VRCWGELSSQAALIGIQVILRTSRIQWQVTPSRDLELNVPVIGMAEVAGPLPVLLGF
jgi:hypothetical protein